MKSSFLKAYSVLLLAIIIPMMLNLFVGRYQPYGRDDCRMVQGVLSDSPENGVSDNESNYIILKIADHYVDDFSFIGCAYSEDIASVVNQLAAGDSVTLYVDKESSSSPWAGHVYETFHIMEASSPKAGTIIDLAQYNRCSGAVNYRIVLLSFGVFMLLGVYLFIRAWREKQNRL